MENNIISIVTGILACKEMSVCLEFDGVAGCKYKCNDKCNNSNNNKYNDNDNNNNNTNTNSKNEFI